MKKIFFTIVTFTLSVLLFSNVTEAKKKDTTKPTVTMTPEETNWTRKSVKINVLAKDASGIKQLLWKYGKIKKSKAIYWEGAKDIKKKKYFKAPFNGWYTVKAVDKNGNSTVQNIKISNIDKEGPAGKLTYYVNNKIATIKVSASDPRGVKSMKWSVGYITSTSARSFPNKVKDNAFTGNINGYYTVRLQDTLGNVSLQMVFVKLWDDLADLPVFDRNEGGLYKGTFYDRWKNTFINPLGIRLGSSGEYYVEYFLNGNYKNFAGTIIRGKGVDDDDKVWLEILADDIVIYTSNQMDYKSNAISFDVPINNAKYLKIKAYSIRNAYGYDWKYTDGYYSCGLYIINGQLYN